MLFDGLGAAEGDDLGRLRGSDRQEGARNDGESIGVVIGGKRFRGCRGVNFTIFTHIEGGEDAREAGQLQGCICFQLLFVFNKLEWPLKGVGKVSGGICQGAGGRESEPRRAHDDDRALAIARSALVCKLERCRARSGEENIGRPVRIEGGQPCLVGSFDGEQVQRPHCDRPAATQRINGAGS